MVVSDNGRTFKPAAREITRIFNDPGVKRYFAKEHTKWTFNLEKAPWWCVVFDRLVKSVKRCLKKTISEARLANEELLAVMIEVEMILNCRPLLYVSSEDYEKPLTPSHLLCSHRRHEPTGQEVIDQVKLKTATQMFNRKTEECVT
mgnify:FL=1